MEEADFVLSQLDGRMSILEANDTPTKSTVVVFRITVIAAITVDANRNKKPLLPKWSQRSCTFLIVVIGNHYYIGRCHGGDRFTHYKSTSIPNFPVLGSVIGCTK
jgi:hypothetical protein